jgi:hypothetical protein
MRSARLVPAAALAAALFGAPAPAARAFLGAGDIVFDPANTAQTINVLRETQQQFDRLGTILGISTRQLDQLVSLATAIGNPALAAPLLQPASAAQLQDSLRAVPGLQDASLDALFTPDGQLDAFMGVPPGQWTQAVENPVGYYRSILVGPAIARLGAAAGLAAPAIAYAQWYASRSPEDRANLEPRASQDISSLLAADWLQGSRQRRVNLQGLATAGRDAQVRSGAAQTVADQQRVQAQLSAGTNSILLESAAQAADANEAAVRQLGAQGRMLQDQDDARRNADEMRLDAPP